ncbi:tetratricopeptide repeat protein (macronuclear) [Tetrahymena thermophila SB210]|uniref:Tetratricopeptide repeat protein n=1 Tax=Tetrahymena thermophila (strain SB210) TaxID=312017 RepID=W7XGA7_TETTS|nr:tetratricopeptide repeat protein [Tetrahymena thermophila SB210]EWS71889.1 tetratricopeptide repeat protein [Tetrahymena thermophila SB210]|eukprot:XP_012655567.1 tetratricopeptide repeat protein [Tetrahymena thermophila SB210]
MAKNDRVSLNIFNDEEQINIFPLIKINEQNYYDQSQNIQEEQHAQLANQVVSEALKEQQQTQQVIANENQKLHNLVFGFKTTIEISFNTIEQDLIKFHNFYTKMIKNKVLVRKQFSYIPCSYRYFAFNNCTELMYKQFNKSNTYVEGFFHRTTFEFDEFSDEKKQRFKNIWDSHILAKSTYIARLKSLIAISDVFQAYDDSLLTTTPMLNMNLTAFQPYQTCITNQTFLENYDPRCRGWYQNTVSQAGKYEVYQYKPYKDAFTNTITMSGTTLLLDEKTDAFLAIIGMDFQIANLIQNILAKLDELDESVILSGYSLIFHENNNTIFHHKYWKNTDDVEYSWQDLEYNSTTIYSIEEKNSFIQQVSNAKAHAESFNYNIEKQINTEQFYISFSKNNLSYYSLVYPINSLQQWQVFPNSTQNRIIMYVGRVQRDLRYILTDFYLLVYRWIQFTSSCSALLSTSDTHRKFNIISQYKDIIKKTKDYYKNQIKKLSLSQEPFKHIFNLKIILIIQILVKLIYC